jgi:hypothetical protein
LATYGLTTQRAALLLGLLLGLVQFFSGRSIWHDEAMLALNIQERSYAQLLRPLDYEQVAPLLWLGAVKTATLLLPGSELAYRLPSLLAYLGSLLLLTLVFRRMKLSHTAALYGMLLFVLNTQVLYFAIEIKQYMSDVLLVLLLVYACQRSFSNPQRQFLTIATLGLLGLLLSHIAPLLLAACGAWLLLQHRHNLRETWLPLSLTALLWFAGFALLYLAFIYEHPSREFMQDYWESRGAFLPLGPGAGAFVLERTRMMFDSLLPINALVKYLHPALFLLGTAALVRRNTSFVLLLVMPLALHWALSALKLYPFEVRLALYLLPMLLILVAAGLDALLRFLPELPSRTARVISFAALALLLSFGGTLNHFPHRDRAIRPVLQELAEEAPERLFVAHFSAFPFRFYENLQPRFADANCALEQHPNYRYSKGKYLLDTTAFVAALSQVQQPFWLITTHTAADSIKRDWVLKTLARQGAAPPPRIQRQGADAVLVQELALPSAPATGSALPAQL